MRIVCSLFPPLSLSSAFLCLTCRSVLVVFFSNFRHRWSLYLSPAAACVRFVSRSLSRFLLSLASENSKACARARARAHVAQKLLTETPQSIYESRTDRGLATVISGASATPGTSRPIVRRIRHAGPSVQYRFACVSFFTRISVSSFQSPIRFRSIRVLERDETARIRLSCRSSLARHQSTSTLSKFKSFQAGPRPPHGGNCSAHACASGEGAPRRRLPCSFARETRGGSGSESEEAREARVLASFFDATRSQTNGGVFPKVRPEKRDAGTGTDIARSSSSTRRCRNRHAKRRLSRRGDELRPFPQHHRIVFESS